MNELSYRLVAQRASNSLRKRLRAEGVSQQEVADEIGISRPTLSTRFNRGGMKLEEFIGVSQAIDADPVELLQSALADSGEGAGHE